MKIKKLLRFYFSADSLERAFDNIIMRGALASADSCNAVGCAEKICGLIGEKSELGKLWNYIDGVITKMSEGDRSSLKDYAAMRFGIKRLEVSARNEIKRAAVKFSRRAKRLESFTEGIRLVGKYYCLLSP